MSEIKKKRGRPKKDIKRDSRMDIRLDVGDRAILEYLSDETGMTKPDIVRAALKNYYRFVRNL